MSYFIFPLQVFTIFLSTSFPTMVSFPEKVVDWVGTYSNEVSIVEPTKVKNTLIIDLKKKDIKTSLIVFTKSHKFYINLVHHDELYQKEIEIKVAHKNDSLTSAVSKENFKLLEGVESLLFINKSDKKIKVGDEYIVDKKYINKGPPVYVEGELIYFGRKR